MASRPFECAVWQEVPPPQHAVPAQQSDPHDTGLEPLQPQAPPLQVSFARPHEVAQSPQCARSVVRSRHHGQGSAGQWSDEPFGHEQVPLEQLPVPQD